MLMEYRRGRIVCSSGSLKNPCKPLRVWGNVRVTTQPVAHTPTTELAMTSTTKAATAERILAIDLGKYKSVLCEYRTGNGEVSFTTIDTTYVELRKQLNKRVPDVVVIEACALSGWVYDLCSDLRLCCRVANTNGEAWKFKHSKRKTDHD